VVIAFRVAVIDARMRGASKLNRVGWPDCDPYEYLRKASRFDIERKNDSTLKQCGLVTTVKSSRFGFSL
jgi:hypothetical protein